MTSRLLLLPFLLVGLQTLRAEDKPADNAAKPVEVAPKDLEKLRGLRHKLVAVEGRLLRSGESKSGTHRYLNFTNSFRESVSLVFQISKNPEEFSTEKLKAWVGKYVRATGTVTEYGSDLQIMIDSWDQIQEIKAPKDAKEAK